jgi:hypothetical protein
MEGDSMRARIGRQEQMKAITLRLPESLHAQLLQHSERDSNRSLNYEIVVRLQASIELIRLLHIEDPDERVAALDKLKVQLIDLRIPEGDE